MKVGISFIEDKIKKRGLLYWTVKAISSNSSGTSYYPSGGGKDDATAEESIEDLNNCLNEIWEYNNEPVTITLKANAANGRKEGPYVLVPEGYEEPEEDEYAAPPAKTRGISGVGAQAAPVITDAYLEKQGYVPRAQMQFEMDKLRAQIDLDMQRRDFEQEKREHRRKMDEEAADLEAKHAKVDNWGHKAARIAETVTANTKVTGNLLGIGLQAAAKALGVDKTQLETLGAAMFSGVEATPEAQPAYPPAQKIETVEAVPVSGVGAVPELDPYALQVLSIASNPNLSNLDKKRILVELQKIAKYAQATPNDTVSPPAV